MNILRFEDIPTPYFLKFDMTHARTNEMGRHYRLSLLHPKMIHGNRLCKNMHLFVDCNIFLVFGLVGIPSNSREL
jgi:hypothetical protein